MLPDCSFYSTARGILPEDFDCFRGAPAQVLLFSVGILLSKREKGMLFNFSLMLSSSLFKFVL
jgi:hypothetical protein